MEIADCKSQFKKYGFSEQQIISLVVQALGCKNAKIQMKGLPVECWLTEKLEVMANDGKRYPKLEEAIKYYSQF